MQWMDLKYSKEWCWTWVKTSFLNSKIIISVEYIVIQARSCGFWQRGWIQPIFTCEGVQQERRSEVRGGEGRACLFGSEFISITLISIVPAPLPLSVTQSSETDWLSEQRQPTCPTEHTHCQFWLHIYPSAACLATCVSSIKDRWTDGREKCCSETHSAKAVMANIRFKKKKKSTTILWSLKEYFPPPTCEYQLPTLCYFHLAENQSFLHKLQVL